MIDKLIISDIHAGILVSRWRDVPGEIAKWNPNLVILNGDVVDSAPTEPIDEWLDALRKIAVERQVVWVRGNHDAPVADSLAAGIGIHLVVDEYPWTDKFENPCLAIHGHIWDSLVMDYPGWSAFATSFYAHFQEVLGIEAAELAKQISKWFSRDAKRVMDGAVAYAQHNKVVNIFCGHVHSYRYRQVNGIKYYNDNCVCNNPGGYFTIDDNGEINYNEF